MSKKEVSLWGLALLVGFMLTSCATYYDGYGYDDFPYYDNGYGYYAYPYYHEHEWGEHHREFNEHYHHESGEHHHDAH